MSRSRTTLTKIQRLSLLPLSVVSIYWTASGCARHESASSSAPKPLVSASSVPDGSRVHGSNPIAEPLKSLLDRMAAIAAESPEVEDTDVRERMHDAIYRAFVLLDGAYAVPAEFGMFTAAGNTAVRSALVTFITDARPLAERAGLTNRRARLNAFQDIRIVASNGQPYDNYFGDREQP